MRTRIVHEGVKHLEYEIRQIVEVAHDLQRLGVDMVWENIGDPIAMGEPVAPWIAEIVHELLEEAQSWAYCPSRGVNETREFLAADIIKRGGVTVGADDLLFVNGIADAVDKVYDLVRRDARILMPSPCYPTHSSNEWKRGDYERLVYHLRPENGWLPDLDELRLQIKYNPQIIAIGYVNPDNPTGLVYPRETIEAIVEIAREFKLFLIADEIYANITYNGADPLHLSSLLGDVPALAMCGISKEYPWPGARCGWIEMLNRESSAEFHEYCQALVNSKMMEVCSTTLPQMSIPRVVGDSRYAGHLSLRAGQFEKRALDAYEAFSELDSLTVNLPQGAIYFPVVFKDGVLNDRQSLAIEDKTVRERVESIVEGVPSDKRFVYYLMGAKGVCVTPLCGFHSDLMGFRITLLQHDDELRKATLVRIVEAIREYLNS